MSPKSKSKANSSPLSAPDWKKLEGGSAEAEWLADRDRKVSLIQALSGDVVTTARALQSRGAIFSPTAELLEMYRFAFDWYTSLAGFSLNTLRNISQAPANFQVTGQLPTLRNKFFAGKAVDPTVAAGVAAWLTDEIDKLWPHSDRSFNRAVIAVSAILGGRALGRGQNVGGTGAVVLLKEALIAYAKDKKLCVESCEGRQWQQLDTDQPPAILSNILRLNGSNGRNRHLICDFRAGGGAPDVIFKVEENSDLVEVAVGEIKARKDTSNTWESWIPQVGAHLQSWTTGRPQSLRLFFGTVITNAMIHGNPSGNGADRRGLEAMYNDRDLHGVYNLSQLAGREQHAVRSFNALMRELRRM